MVRLFVVLSLFFIVSIRAFNKYTAPTKPIDNCNCNCGPIMRMNVKSEYGEKPSKESPPLPTTTNVGMPPHKPSCEYGWDLVGLSCYKYMDGNFVPYHNYSLVTAVCEELDGYPATFESYDEYYRFVIWFANNNYFANCLRCEEKFTKTYVGGKREGDEGHYITPLGDNYKNLGLYGTRNLAGESGADCLMFVHDHDQGSYFLQVMPCDYDDNISAVCEQRPVY